MKRNVLAILVPALLLAGAANAAEIYNKDSNKLDLYGKVDARHQFSEDTGSDGDATYVRIGFKGETQITQDLTGYGQWEYNIQANDTEGSSNQSATRLGFAGLKFGEFGSFDYGRNYGVVYDVEAWTDMLPVFGGDSYTYTDNFMVGRGNGMATYRNSDFFGLVEGLSFAIQYQGANEGSNSLFDQEGTANRSDDGTSIRSDNGDGFGLSTTYDFGMGFSVGAAYASSDRTNEQQGAGAGAGNNRYSKYAGGEEAQAWTLGAKYDANQVYLAMMYSETENMTPYGDEGIANKTQNFEAVAQYQFDFGLRPSLAWVYSKGNDLGGNIIGNGNTDYVDQDLVNYIDIGANYYFNKNFSTYIDYKINLLDGDDDFYEDNAISTDDVVGIGMIYQF